MKSHYQVTEDTCPVRTLNQVPDPKKRTDWSDIAACRATFDEYAREKGFNPLDPEDWYAQEIKELSKMRVGHANLPILFGLMQ